MALKIQKKSAIKVIIAGAVMSAIGFVLVPIILLPMYGKAGRCVNTNDQTCSLTKETFGVHAAVYLIYLSGIVILIGVVLLLIAEYRDKQNLRSNVPKK